MKSPDYTDQIPPEHYLCCYAASLKFEDIDVADQRRVTEIIFDTIGVGIGAVSANLDSGRIVEAMFLEQHVDSRKGNSTLWSGKARGNAPDVAACNGTWAEVLDFQDTVVDPRNNGHAAVTIVPAALAIAERESASGKQLIAAVAAGLEVTIAILRCIGRAHRADGRGFRTSSIAAPLGAAVACAKILQLDQSGLLNSMGLAGACAPNGLMPSLSPTTGAFGMDKDWVNGLAAQLAVNSADLAARGMSASDRVVTGDRGIGASHAHGHELPLFTPDSGTPNIGHIALKKYASCYGVHSAMEASMALIRQHGLRVNSVNQVTVYVKTDSKITLAGRQIRNHMAARFSLAYSVAMVFVRNGEISICDFEEPAIKEPAILTFMEKILIKADPQLTEFHEQTGGFPARVDIVVKGRTLTSCVEYPHGSVQNPMSRAELANKFKQLTDRRWSGVHQQEIIDTGYRLQSLDDVNLLTKLF